MKKKKTEKQKALILGGGNDQVPLFPILKSKGIYTILVDYYDNPPAKHSADKHYKQSALDKNIVRNIAIKEGVGFIISAGNDPAVSIMADVSYELGLPFNLTPETAILSTDKAKMKSLFFANNIPTSNFVEAKREEFSNIDLSGLRFPVITKLRNSCSSRGVKKSKNTNELNRLLKSCYLNIKDSSIIIEEFCAGKEVSTDCFVVNGEVHVIAMTELIQVPSHTSNFSFLQSITPARLIRTEINNIELIANNIAESFGINNGPFFFQCKVNNNEVNIIEIGARTAGGGKMSRVEFVTKVNILEQYVNWLSGLPVEIVIKQQNRCTALNHIYGKKGRISKIENVDRLYNDETSKHIKIKHKLGDDVSGGYEANMQLATIVNYGNSLDQLRAKVKKSIELFDIKDNNRSLLLKDMYFSNPLCLI